MRPLVSAVIPTFNYGRYVRDAVRSVLAQSYGPIECIVVDDGSTDDTTLVLGEFGDRIQVIRKKNGGLAAARNTGIDAARGEFVAFLDADDRWHPEKIERQVDLLRSRPTVGCVGCGFEHVTEDGSIERVVAGQSNSRSRTSTLRNLAVRSFWVGGSGSGAVIRSSVLERVGQFDPQLRAAEDWDMWLRLADQTEIDNVKAVLVSINRHRTGMFRNVQLMAQNQWAVYAKAVAAWPHVLTDTIRRRMRAMILSDAGGECLGIGQREEAFGYYVRSLYAWPFNYRRTVMAAALGTRCAYDTFRRRHGQAGSGQR